MATNSTLTPVVAAKTKGKKPKHDIVPKDMTYSRNFTKDGKPRLNAVSRPGSGEGASGQRR